MTVPQLYVQTALARAVAVEHVLAEQLRARRLGQAVREFDQVREVVRRMVGVREVTRPEEAVLADDRDHPGHGTFIRIAGDPALPAEVLTRFVLQGHTLAVRGLIDRIHTFDPIANPARANLQYH